jgi:hypothetical protein
MTICHNRELKTRTILFLFFLAYMILWIYSFALSWAKDIIIIGPKPEFDNYTAILEQIPEFSDQIPTYVLSIVVILYLFLK